MAKLQKVVMTPYLSDEEVVFPKQEGGNFSMVPEQHVAADVPKNKIKRYAMERQRKLLKIILRLATVNGYDNQERIKLKNGSYLEQSDVVSLLLYTLSPGKKVVGLEDFVDLLREAGVTSDMVINENVKAMLENRQPPMSSHRHRRRPKEISPPVPAEQEDQGMEYEVVANKRKRDEVSDSEDPKVAPITLKRVIRAKRSRIEPPTAKRTLLPPPTFQPKDNTFRDRNTGWIQSSEEEDNDSD